MGERAGCGRRLRYRRRLILLHVLGVLSRRRVQTQKDASVALNLVSIYSDIRRVFLYLNNLKDLDSSCKTDLGFWNCFWKENTF